MHIYCWSEYLVKIFIQVKICCKVTSINKILFLMWLINPCGFYGNLKYAEDYNWHRHLIKAVSQGRHCTGNGLTHNLDRTTRLAQVSPAFAGQIFFLLTQTQPGYQHSLPQQSCKLPAKQWAGFGSMEMSTYHWAKPFIKSSWDKSMRTFKKQILFVCRLFSI